MSLSSWLYWIAAAFLLGALALTLTRGYVQVTHVSGALGMLLLSASAYYDHSKSLSYRAAWMAVCILFVLIDMAIFTRHWLHHKEERDAVQGKHEGQVDGVPPEEAGR